MSTLKAHLIRYWAAMTAAAFQSGIHAIVGFGGLAGIEKATSIPIAISLQQGGALFLVAFARAILQYLESHPIAEFLPDIETVAQGTESTEATQSIAAPESVKSVPEHTGGATPATAVPGHVNIAVINRLAAIPKP